MFIVFMQLLGIEGFINYSYLLVKYVKLYWKDKNKGTLSTGSYLHNLPMPISDQAEIVYTFETIKPTTMTYLRISVPAESRHFNLHGLPL